MWNNFRSATLQIWLTSDSKQRWITRNILNGHVSTVNESIDSLSGRVLCLQIHSMNLDLVVYCTTGLTCMWVESELNQMQLPLFFLGMGLLCRSKSSPNHFNHFSPVTKATSWKYNRDQGILAWIAIKAPIWGRVGGRGEAVAIWERWSEICWESNEGAVGTCAVGGLTVLGLQEAREQSRDFDDEESRQIDWYRFDGNGDSRLVVEKSLRWTGYEATWLLLVRFWWIRRRC